MNYEIIIGNDVDPQDFDILLMTEFKNIAAFMVCGKSRSIVNKILGSEDAQRQGAIKRMEIREIMGNKLMREVTLKWGIGRAVGSGDRIK